jgi:hypothetical protein
MRLTAFCSFFLLCIDSCLRQILALTLPVGAACFCVPERVIA